MGIEYIKEIKKERGLTNEELSKLSGVPLGTLNKILSGHTPDPQFETVKAICKALGISLATLDDYENTRKASELLFGKNSTSFTEYISRRPDITTIAAHHDEEDWTEEELNEIEEFKKFVLSKRNK